MSQEGVEKKGGSAGGRNRKICRLFPGSVRQSHTSEGAKEKG